MLIDSLFSFETDKKMRRVEEAAGINDPPVSHGSLLEPRFRFPKVSYDEAVNAYEVAHLLAEAFYRGDGYWESSGAFRSPVRHTAQRVLGYIAGYRALGNDIYRNRALEGLNHLLETQCAEGDFPCYRMSNRGIRNSTESLLETATAGLALIEGYRLTNDPRCFHASAKTAAWEITCPVTGAVDSNIAAAEHLITHHAIANDTQILDTAVEFAENAIKTQLPSGGWPGRDSWMRSHGIITRGLAVILRNLPENHPLIPDLTQSLTAALNRAIREQMASGEIPPNHRVKQRGYTCPHILLALLASRQIFGDALDRCIAGAMRFRLQRTAEKAIAQACFIAWDEHRLAMREASHASSGSRIWSADFNRFIKDVDWGEVSGGAFPCQVPRDDLYPMNIKLVRAISERTGLNAQEVTLVGDNRGGIGWSVPWHALAPGRRYRFSASVKCSCDSIPPILFCSAYSGRQKEASDPVNNCELTRENAMPGSYTELAVDFTAAGESNYIYVWAVGEYGQISLTVDKATITDAGLPLPQWTPMFEAFDPEPDMMLFASGSYLDSMRRS